MEFHYKSNTKAVDTCNWTGSAYQVGLDNEKDFFSTDVLQVFEKDPSKHAALSKFTTKALQFHFHNPGEHTIDGEEFDLELHIVHTLNDVPEELAFNYPKFVVTTVFMKVASSVSKLNCFQKDSLKFYDDFMKKVILQQEGASVTKSFCQSGEAAVSAGGIDLMPLLDRINFEKRWLYRGSFTTPPCTEGVLFNIIDDVQYILPETLELYRESRSGEEIGDHRCSKCGGNNRVVQPLHDRQLYYVTYKQHAAQFQDKYTCKTTAPQGSE